MCLLCILRCYYKAFDRVNHFKLFKKLIMRHVHACSVRLLQYWYAHQTIQVKWGSSFSESFLVNNGVRQGGVLSPYLFAVYIDDLSPSVKLIKLWAGCCVGNSLIYVVYLLALLVRNLLLIYALNMLWRMI